MKTVIIDEDRAEHIRWAFESYATAQWSIAELTDELERRGLKSRPTRKYVGSPLTRSEVHRLLTNIYYTGKVPYGGFVYDGKHDALVDEQTFAEVQTVLGSRRLAGDRAWKRQQYLKGSVYCGRCGERLGYGHSRGHGGEYPYFFCLGRHRKRNDCDLPYLAAHKVEAAVMAVWDDMTFSDELTELVVKAMQKQFKELEARSERTLKYQRRRVIDLERQKQKLLDAYIADAFPVEDLKLRQEKVQAELTAARKLTAQASALYDDLERKLELCTRVLRVAGRLYRACQESRGSPSTRCSLSA